MVQLEYGADESYRLVVASQGKPSYAQLEVSSSHAPTKNYSFYQFFYPLIVYPLKDLKVNSAL